MPRTISTASRMGPSVRFVIARMLLRKIFEVPKPSRNRPGPAASCTTRASMATCTGWRVKGEMIPQPIVRRAVSRAITADTTVEERASIPCFRHHGYASASQIVSIPASSMTRAEASISSSGSIVSCITPIRNGADITKTDPRIGLNHHGAQPFARRRRLYIESKYQQKGVYGVNWGFPRTQCGRGRQDDVSCGKERRRKDEKGFDSRLVRADGVDRARRRHGNGGGGGRRGAGAPGDRPADDP